MKQAVNPDQYLDDDLPPHAGSTYKHVNREASRQRKPSNPRFLADLSGQPQKLASELLPEFMPTFQATDHERYWILNYLEEFYNNQVITDVLFKVKGGKEANVYCCAAHPSTGLDLIAAKLYRPRMFRNLRNDARYRQGREVRDSDGKVARSSREMRAIQKNTRFGQALRHSTWLEAEYSTLHLLHQASADVPKPIAHNDNVILMEYVGTRDSPAPALTSVSLAKANAHAIFNRILVNLSTMLRCHIVHADFSAYNVLYWDHTFCIIDFPQAVDPRRNSDAQYFFTRDVARICQYFNHYGIHPNPSSLARSLWEQYRYVNALDAGIVEEAET
jgi:RIO kinase 1